MKVLVTGANGFVGQALCDELSAQQYDVVAAVRSNIQVDGCKSIAVGSVDGQTDWASALAGVDVVVHLIAHTHVVGADADSFAEPYKTNVDGTLNLALQAANASVKRFIFISSIKVNGDYTEADKPFTEDIAPSPQDAYGLSKHKAEQDLMKIAKDTGLEFVIIRPPLVYGYGVKANFASLMSTVKRGIPLPLGAIHNKRSYVYVGNLVNMIMCCINHQAAANQVFLVSDGHDLSTTELLQGCAEALNVKSRLLPIPQSIIEGFAALVAKQTVAKRLCGNLQADISKARIKLGWVPPFSVAHGLKVTAHGLLHG